MWRGYDAVAARMERLRLLALIPTLLGLTVATGVMAMERAHAWGVPLGALALVLATAGLLAMFGFFGVAGTETEREDEAAAPVAVTTLSRRVLLFVAACAGFVMAVRAAVGGTLPPWAPSSLLIVLLAAAALAAVVHAAQCFPSRGESLSRREGPWLVGAALLSYLPGLGKTSLIDPWETHYGEVAREVLARNDWISFWWAQDGFFWSKPALSIWLEALSFSVFGVRHAPDAMLSAAAAGRVPEPEWAVRLPAMTLAVIAAYFAYKLVAHAAGRRSGFVAGLVLLTTPFWSLLARQATTDMPYVAGVSVAVALAGIGLMTDARARVRAFAVELGAHRLRLHLGHLAFALITLTALAQICYLASRHVVFDAGSLVLRGDQFQAGSGGGLCALQVPGNDPCAALGPEYGLAQPGLLALVWASALLSLLLSQRNEDRIQRLCFVGAWYALSLASLAKGAPGLVLPLAVAAGFAASSGKLRELERFELPALALILACVTLPWYVQAYARHGRPFFERLFLHDMYARAFEHVHDTNAGDDVSIGYYAWQLGYGLFPWSAWAAAGGLAALGVAKAASPRARLFTLLACWFALTFAVFTLALTKYHHYILPAVVPAALLAGLALERGLEHRAANSVSPGISAAIGLSGLFASALILLVGRDLVSAGRVEGQARLMHLFTYNYSRPWPPTLHFEGALWFVAVLTACLSATWLIPKLRRLAGGALLATGAVCSLFVVHVYFARASSHYGQRELLLEYYARRAGPEQPIVAYQMNWKGENFYTGNRVAVFVTSGSSFRSYVEGLRSHGERTFFVMTEHHRKDSLLEELGPLHRFQALTGPELNNKFLLARVEL